MVIVDHRGKEIELPVSGSLCGRRIKEIRLEAKDIKQLVDSLRPEQLHNLMYSWVMRFPPE